MRISRREFVGSAAALTIAGGVTRADSAPDVEVAIVGAGAAGTYAAWRLRQERPELRVRLFEAGDRIGGRLRSVAFPQAPHLIAELGGMRFLDAHRHVSGLARKLDLKTRDYPIDHDANRMMLRGRNYSLKQVHNGHARFPYRIPDADQAPGAAFFDRAIAKVLPNAAHMSPADWRKVRAAYRFKGKLLKDWSNRDLLLEGMSAEELAFTEDSSGYDDWIEGETGLDELDYYFVHDDEDKPFNTLADGYQQLPLSLADGAAEIWRWPGDERAAGQPAANPGGLSAWTSRIGTSASRPFRRPRSYSRCREWRWKPLSIFLTHGSRAFQT